MAENHEHADRLLHELRPYRTTIPCRALTLHNSSFEAEVCRWRDAASSEASTAEMCRVAAKQLRDQRVPCHVKDSLPVAEWFAQLPAAPVNSKAVLLEHAQRAALEFCARECDAANCPLASCASTVTGRVLLMAPSLPATCRTPRATLDTFRDTVAEFATLHCTDDAPDDDTDVGIANTRLRKLGRWLSLFQDPVLGEASNKLPEPIDDSPEEADAPPKLTTSAAFKVAEAWKKLVVCFDQIDEIRIAESPRGAELAPSEIKLWLGLAAMSDVAAARVTVGSPTIVSTGPVGLAATLFLRGVVAANDRQAIPTLPASASSAEAVWPHDAGTAVNPFAFATEADAMQASRAMRRAVTWSAVNVCAPTTV